MNYFELFGIPVSLTVNKAALTPTYFALQKKFHPDYFGNANEAEQDAALEQSSQVNKAWKTFQQPDETIKYVLQLKGLLEDEEKFTMPPDFLMEVLELNELKMDGADASTIAARTNALQNEIRSEVDDIIEQYEDGVTPEADLLRVKTYYYKKKYLDRLLEG